MNPGGSSKDRIAKQMVLEAEASGLLKKGGTIVEGTAGSTGISLSLMAASRGYKCRIVMPNDAAKEKTDLLKKFWCNCTNCRSSVNRERYALQ